MNKIKIIILLRWIFLYHVYVLTSRITALSQDVACFPVKDNKNEDLEDNNSRNDVNSEEIMDTIEGNLAAEINLGDNTLVIPGSRRSSFHGDSIHDLDSKSTNMLEVNLPLSRRSSQDLSNPEIS